MIDKLSVAQLALQLEKRELSAVDVFKYYSEKEDAYGTYLYKNTDGIKLAENIDKRRYAGEKLSQLAGIPIAVKDNICTKNMPTTCASKTLEGFLPPYNATVVEKLNANDMPVLGKTNMDEFAMGSTGENSAFFKTINPIDPLLTPGGSSSGSAAAVSGNLAPIALGSDTGGSVRMPAQMCKICGFKPSYGAISRFGLVAFASSLDQIGILSQNVSDCKLLFDALRGRDINDMTSIDICEKGIVNPKTAYFVKNESGLQAGEIELSMLQYLLPVYYIISSAEAASNLARYDGVRYGRDSEFGAEVMRRIELGNFVLSADNVGEYYNRACRARTLLCREMDKLFDSYDFIFMPTLTDKVQKINEKCKPSDIYSLDAYTVLANLAYLPAISLPIGESGVTILARRGNDIALLKFAEEVLTHGI